MPGARHFKYPPFAAFVFQPLAHFPLQVAAALLSLVNLVLWVLAVYLTRHIVDRTFPDRNPSPVPLLVAVVCSAQFFLDNFHHTQVNGVLLILVLLGLHAYLREQDLRAAFYLASATALKITPIFFVAWLLLRGRRRAALAVPPMLLSCVLLPLVIRGPTTGVSDLVEYYHTFLEGHQHGVVSGYTIDQNLAAFVNRMTRPTSGPEQVSYRYLPTSERTAQRIYQTLWVSILLGFLLRLGWLRIQRLPVSAFELGLVFVTGLLLSPITLPAHFVSMIFVFYAFLAVKPRALPRALRLPTGVLWVAVAIVGLSGRDLVGRTAYLAVRGYSLYVGMLLLMFLLAAVLAGRMTLPRRLIP